MLADLLPSDIPNARIYSFGPAFLRENYPSLTFRFLVKFWAFTSLCLILIGLTAPSLRFIALLSALFISGLRGLLFLWKYLSNLHTTPATEIENQALLLLRELAAKVECLLGLHHSIWALYSSDLRKSQIPLLS